MYGLIGKLKAIPGRRDDLSKILLDGAAGISHWRARPTAQLAPR